MYALRTTWTYKNESIIVVTFLCKLCSLVLKGGFHFESWFDKWGAAVSFDVDDCRTSQKDSIQFCNATKLDHTHCAGYRCHEAQSYSLCWL